MNITKSIKFVFIALSIFTSTMSFAQTEVTTDDYAKICKNSTIPFTRQNSLQACIDAKPTPETVFVCTNFAIGFSDPQVLPALKACFALHPTNQQYHKFMACNALATNSLEIKIGCVKSAFSVDQIMLCKVRNEQSINNQLSCLNKLLEGR